MPWTQVAALKKAKADYRSGPYALKICESGLRTGRPSTEGYRAGKGAVVTAERTVREGNRLPVANLPRIPKLWR